jgi:hypothetical protein
MNSNRRTATVVGALFLTAMGASLLGGGLIGSALDVSDPVAAANDSSAKLVVGVLLELVNCAAVIGIAVLLFPVLRRRSPAMAFGYVGFRIIETALIAVAAVIPLALIEVGQRYSGADGDAAGGLGTALLATREQLLGLGVATFFCLGAFVLYHVLYASKLTPRFIAVWGFIGVAAVFALNVIQALAGGEATSATMVLAVPIISNEIFLGVWLMTKGFNEAPGASQAVRSGADEVRLESA